ncbi:MAG: hypothetical protein OER12_07445, partial [Acidimicrobiia bacterium]|nr:hypothetical protein [Acidimicrobiia bacterium]
PTPARLGDEALTEILESALAGGSFRVGESLAEFGIQWIVATDPGPVVDALDAQLDLLPLALPDTLAYQVEGDAPRAIDESGVLWTPSGIDFVGPGAGGTVRLAENADSRWSGQWVQDGWANRVTVDTGIISFGPIRRLRTASIVALAWVGLLVIGVAAIRGRSR